jgi:signal transduction histidine kinase
VFRVRESAVHVHTDPSLLELILRNLISNAINYTSSGGILIGCRQRGEHLLIEVWDTGIGIPPAQQQEVFREFHQLGNPERDRRKGLGLGLAIVRGLAHTMGLKVELQSRPAAVRYSA